MPLLNDTDTQKLLWQARLHRNCEHCGHFAAYDYCRTCDEFYWLHAPGCLFYEEKHFGHRLTIVPFVEECLQPYIVCPRCGMVSHNRNDVRERYCGNCHAFHDDMRK